MEYQYPNCPVCNRKGQIVEQYVRRCLYDDCTVGIFIRNGPYEYAIRCFHTTFCQKDQQNNPKVCVSHCDSLWNTFTFNQAEFIRMLHESQNEAHVVEVIKI